MIEEVHELQAKEVNQVSERKKYHIYVKLLQVLMNCYFKLISQVENEINLADIYYTWKYLQLFLLFSLEQI
jgi:hypothetical protein